jgi:hypothetical protein
MPGSVKSSRSNKQTTTMPNSNENEVLSYWSNLQDDKKDAENMSSSIQLIFFHSIALHNA